MVECEGGFEIDAYAEAEKGQRFVRSATITSQQSPARSEL